MWLEQRQPKAQELTSSSHVDIVWLCKSHEVCILSCWWTLVGALCNCQNAYEALDVDPDARWKLPAVLSYLEIGPCGGLWGNLPRCRHVMRIVRQGFVTSSHAHIFKRIR
jgi:hypothetical protein